MIGRREVITLLGGAAAWPIAARAQQATLALVGLLSGLPVDNRSLNAIRQGLKETGFVEGRNLAITYRSADARLDHLPGLAAELVRDSVAAIIALAPPAALAAKAATTTVPIVFATGSDPVALGLVQSFNRPGGNATGVHFPVTTLVAKRLELLRELVPNASSIGYLANPTQMVSVSQTKEAQAASRTLGFELAVRNASNEREIDTSFASFAAERMRAVLVSADAFFLSRRDQLVGLAARHAIPSMFHLREVAVSGGLMSYGPNLADAYRLAGAYTGRILKGEKAGDLPIQQSVKFELVINLKTAKALGLAVPDTVLARADEVIE
jgi:ABC-type uncharacterized transport system substrate-binding protein